MARIHLFEFSDQGWFPRLLRDYFTDYLTQLFATFHVYESVIPLLQRVMDCKGTSQVLDLCSGASGPWLRLFQKFREENSPVKVTLSDKYPNLESFRRASRMADGQIDYIASPVDPTKSLPETGVICTLFSSFHHFRPPESRRLLKNAVEAHNVICVFEMTERDPVTILLTLLLGPLVLLCLTPLIRPFSVGRLFWTYLVPVVPIVYVWDGVVSHLRTYSIQELRSLVAPIESNGYEWEISQIPVSLRSNPFPVTYLLGYPCQPGDPFKTR
jgi:hypothetical protein